MTNLEPRLPAPFRGAFSQWIPDTVPQPVFNALMHVLQVEKTDRLYQDLRKGPPAQFCERLLSSLRVEVKVTEEDLKRIPKTGAVVAVANHPFGIVEGVALAELLPRIRPDVKIMANQLLGEFQEIADRIICVDPYGGPSARRANAKGMREALEWLEQGGMLLVFPAGEVSQLQFQFPRWQVADPVWSESIARLLQKTKAVALPMFIDGRNSALFQLAGLVHPRLRTALLPHELLNKQRRSIELRCGAVIGRERMERFATAEELVAHLRWRTYLLRKRDRRRVRRQSGGKAIAAAMPRQSLLLEMRRAPLLEAGEFQVFAAPGHEIPATLREIGRLREESFRQVGEGTGEALDLDRFDAHYHHLYLWNREKQEIAGAYRLGLVDELLAKGGVKALYTRTLFEFDERFLEKLGPAIELGRSFIPPAYQRSFQPLLLLWKGIGRFVLEHAPARVLFGPVSVSADYARVSRELMVSVLSQQNGNQELASLVRARRPLRPHWDSMKPIACDLEELGDLIADLEADGKSIPVLLRQYMKLGGQLVAFNVDPKFGNCLDGLIVVDLAKTEPRLLERYMGTRPKW
jgi:putative hemolysin